MSLLIYSAKSNNLCEFLFQKFRNFCRFLPFLKIQGQYPNSKIKAFWRSRDEEDDTVFSNLLFEEVEIVPHEDFVMEFSEFLFA